MRILRNMLLILALSFSAMTIVAADRAYAAPPAPSAPAAAQSASSSQKDACAGLQQLDSTQGCSTGEKGITKIVAAVVNILSMIVGIFAVIMIIISGFKYITSGGDSNKTASAKSTLVYALVGVAVVALAQFLVHFVFTAATKV